MAIHRAPEDAYVKEQAKWERQSVMINGTYIEAVPVSQGGRKDFPLTEYPKALYRAESADGGPRISGYREVADEGQERLAKGQGWHESQEEALEAVTAQELEYARLAANRAHNDRWMSQKARDEAAVVDEATMQHLPSIPETPILKRQPKEGK